MAYHHGGLLSIEERKLRLGLSEETPLDSAVGRKPLYCGSVSCLGVGAIFLARLRGLGSSMCCADGHTP